MKPGLSFMIVLLSALFIVSAVAAQVEPLNRALPAAEQFDNHFISHLNNKNNLLSSIDAGHGSGPADLKPRTLARPLPSGILTEIKPLPQIDRLMRSNYSRDIEASA